MIILLFTPPHPLSSRWVESTRRRRRRRVEKRHATKEIKSSRAAFFFARKISRRSKDRELEKHGSVELLSLPPSSLCNRHGSKYPGCVVIVHRSKRGRGGNNPGRKNRKHRPQARVYKYTPRYTVPREQSGHRASEQRPASNRSDIEISRIGLISSG